MFAVITGQLEVRAATEEISELQKQIQLKSIIEPVVLKEDQNDFVTILTEKQKKEYQRRSEC